MLCVGAVFLSNEVGVAEVEGQLCDEGNPPVGWLLRAALVSGSVVEAELISVRYKAYCISRDRGSSLRYEVRLKASSFASSTSFVNPSMSSFASSLVYLSNCSIVISPSPKRINAQVATLSSDTIGSVFGSPPLEP